MKKICLVVVRDGLVDVYESKQVDCRIVDLDNSEIRYPVILPAGIGFEDLAKRAQLVLGLDVVFK